MNPHRAADDMNKSWNGSCLEDGGALDIGQAEPAHINAGLGPRHCRHFLEHLNEE